MILNWGLTNFKSLYNADLDLAPLTVLTGTNSSGKSSFIQSILLIAQTMLNYDADLFLVLNGFYFDLGQFNEIVSFHESNDGEQQLVPIGIRFTCNFFKDPLLYKEKVSHYLTDFNIEFNAVGKDDVNFQKEQLLPRLKSVEQTLKRINNSGIYEEIKKCFIPNPSELHIDPMVVINKKLFSHFWPIVNIKADSSNFSDYSEDNNIYHDFIGYFRYRFTYLGPLRHHDSLYPHSKSFIYGDVGLKGEYTAAVLDIQSNDMVSYIPVKYLYNPGLERAVINRPLKGALKYWLKYFSITDEIKPILTKHGYELRAFAENGKNFNANLSNVGTGISQILPILVSCLLAKKGSTLIFEQPELHLHPRIQSCLVDFFISMALTDKQCIIETHSEYFIDMLRLRICQSLLKENYEVKNATKIYYFDKKELKSIVNEIEINEFGDYNIWPDDFFDERQRISENILNSINERMFSDKTEISIEKENQLYVEEIYIEEKNETVDFFFFDSINIFKEIIDEYMVELYIKDYFFNNRLEWTLDQNISENVKNAMNKYNVNYCLSICVEENETKTIIIKRDDGEWFLQIFIEPIEQKENSN